MESRESPYRIVVIPEPELPKKPSLYNVVMFYMNGLGISYLLSGVSGVLVGLSIFFLILACLGKLVLL